MLSDNCYKIRLIMEQLVSDFAKTINMPICRFFDEIADWPQASDKQPLSFLSGDPTIYHQDQFQMPPRGSEYVRENIMKEENHGYIKSTGTEAFRQKVAKLYKSKVNIKASDVQINHGVNMGLLAVMLALTNEGDEVLVPQMGYPFYHDLCPALKRKAIPYRLLKQKNFQIDLDHLSSLLSEKTAFMYIINPTNPTGTVFSRQHMEDILSFSEKHEVPLVCDQVYFRMVFPGVEALSFAQLTENVPVIVLSGLEKTMTVPGWVQSWTVVVDKYDIFEQLKKNLEVVATLFLHTNTFVQHSMPQILDEIGLIAEKNMGEIQKTYQYLLGKLSNIQGVRAIPAQGTIYLSVEVDLAQFKDIQNDVDLSKKFKAEEAVSVLPLSIMGKGLEGLRLLTCAKEEMYEQFFLRLKRFLDRHRQ